MDSNIRKIQRLSLSNMFWSIITLACVGIIVYLLGLATNVIKPWLQF